MPAGFVFIPLDATLGYHDRVVRALLSRPDAALPTMAGLKLQAERGIRLTLPGPDGPLPLALAVVTGAGTEPDYYWIRDDGSNALLGIVWPGYAVIEKGYESLVPALLTRQLQAQDERLVQLRRRLAQPIEGATLIRGVRWFDAPAARMRGPSDVWLFDGRIGAVVPPGALQARPDRVVEGAGRTLLPGLWDMHAHMWPEGGLAHLAGGVTSVRDPANLNEEILRLQRRTARGELAGPAIHIAGFIEGKSAYSSRNGFVVDSVEAGLALDRALLRVGHYLGALEPGLARQFLRTHAEIQMRGDQASCLARLAWRTGLPELDRLANTLQMAQQYGSPLAETMRTISQEARQMRRLALEEQAGSLPGKITLIQMALIMLPMLVLIIAPTLNLLINSLR